MAKLEDAKHEMFCNEYIKDLHLTDAYLRVYPKSKPDTARANVHRLIANESIQARIRELMQIRAKRTNIEQDRVVQRLANIAFGDLGMVCTWDADGLTLIEHKDLTPQERAIIDSIETSPVTEEGAVLGHRKKIKMKDSLKALELLGKHLGMYDGSGSGKKDPSNAKERFLTAFERVAEKLGKRSGT